MTPTKIYRSSKDKVLFGVAGGLAEYINADPEVVPLANVTEAVAKLVGGS